MARPTKPESAKGSAARNPRGRARPAVNRAGKPQAEPKGQRGATEIVARPQMSAREPLRTERLAEIAEPSLALPTTDPEAEPVAATSATPAAAAVAHPAAPHPAEDATVLSVPTALRDFDRLRGVVLGFWQSQFERTLTTGQALLGCRSPQAALRLQLAYTRATFEAGTAHAGELAQLAAEITRALVPLRGH